MRMQIVAAVLLASVTTACVSMAPPTTVTQVSVEDQKRDIARLRDQGRITYLEAARRQYAIQQANYTLTPGEEAFWRESIAQAALVDRGRITPAEYRRRVQIAYSRNVRT